MSKVTIKPSKTVLNTIDVTIDQESHTAAAVIVERLNADPCCEFAAYKLNHPTDTYVSIRVQGNETKNAKDIFKQSLIGIIKDVDDLLSQVKQINE